MTALKNINFGLNQYCGPAVLSALTGKSTDECAAVISGISGSQEIKAVKIDHLIKAIEKLRFDVTERKTHNYSLFGTLSSLADSHGAYVILVPKHVVAVEVTSDRRIYLIDNHTKQPLDAANSARLSQRVEKVYLVTPRAAPKLLETKIKMQRGNSHLHMHALDLYEDERDNVKYNMGYIYFRNDGELKELITQLGEMYDSKS